MTRLRRRLNAAGYEATLGSIKTPVVVGGIDINANEFVPAVNCSFHPTPAHPRGEAFIDINHLDGVKTARTETEVDGEITHEGGGFKHVMKVLDDDTLKWDMIFDAPPPALRFRIKHSKNLDFHKQVITPEQLIEGHRYRRPEVEGSYAVYFNNGRRDNKYQTGKVCQIDSPYFIDAAGAKSPLCGMTLIEVEPGVKRLVLDLPDRWLNDSARVYPLRLDPVIGYDTIGGLSGGLFTTNWVNWFNPTQATENGVPLNFNIYATNSYLCKGGGAETTDAPVYPANGQDLIGYTGEFTTLAGALTTVTMTASKGLTTGKWYRAGVVPKVSGADVAYDNLALYRRQTTGGPYADEMLDPVGAQRQTSNSSQYASMWITYGPAEATFNRSRIVNMGATGPQNRSTIANA